MKEVKRYISDDDVMYDNKEDCIKHDKLIKKVSKIESKLPPRPDDMNFGNGDGYGYIQHNEDVLLQVRNEDLELDEEYTDHKWIQETIDKGFDAHPSYAYRIISEYRQMKPIETLWNRIYCTDSSFREWGQPYFALNPDKGKDVCLNC